MRGGGQLVRAVEIVGDTITVQPDDDFADRFLRDDFRVVYDVDGGVLTIPEGLAVVPFLANVAPIVWLAGLDVRVPVLDATFASALDEVRKILAGMYPSLAWDGSITADHVALVEAPTDQVAVLFSGGVDSVYSSIGVDEPQLLVTIRGSDIALANDTGWDAVRHQAIEFGRERGHRNAFVQSNLRQFLDIPTLESRWPTVDDWWGGVQHGLGLLGLLAPVVHSGRVVIAATHSSTFDGQAIASNPTLDTSVRWGRVKVDHHGYEATRQDKVEAIVADEGPPAQLRVCYSNPYGDGGNCGLCEKCLRTYAALVVAGADPTTHGFALPPRRGTRTIRRRFATYRVAFTVNKAWHWGEIQKSASDRLDSDSDFGGFLRWLSTFDFVTYERRWRFFLGVRKRLLRGLRRFPAAESTVRRGVAASHNLRRRMHQRTTT